MDLLSILNLVGGGRQSLRDDRLTALIIDAEKARKKARFRTLVRLQKHASYP